MHTLNCAGLDPIHGKLLGSGYVTRLGVQPVTKHQRDDGAQEAGSWQQRKRKLAGGNLISACPVECVCVKYGHFCVH